MVKNAQFSGFYHENRRKINKTPIKQGLETNFFTYKSLLVHVKKFVSTREKVCWYICKSKNKHAIFKTITQVFSNTPATGVKKGYYVDLKYQQTPNMNHYAGVCLYIYILEIVSQIDEEIH